MILRSTIIALRNLLEAGIDLLRLECLESLDYKTRDRLLDKKYKLVSIDSTCHHFFSQPSIFLTNFFEMNHFLPVSNRFIISTAPLNSLITNMFAIPFFGQFFKSSNNSHIWSKLFYYHISGYGPPSLLLTKGKR